MYSSMRRVPQPDNPDFHVHDNASKEPEVAPAVSLVMMLQGGNVARELRAKGQGLIDQGQELLDRGQDLIRLADQVESLQSPAEPAPSKLLVSVEEAGKMLDLGRNLAYDLVHRGELRSIRIGHSIKVPTSALHEWVKARAAG